MDNYPKRYQNYKKYQKDKPFFTEKAYSPVTINPKYDEYTRILLLQASEIELIADSFIAQDVTDIAFDTETDSLDLVTGKIVGFSFAFKEEIGFYVPLYHKVGQNIDFPGRAVSALERMFKHATRILMFNALFDIRVTDFNLFKFPREKTIDLQIAVWLLDTNVKLPALKQSALELLGWSMDKFKELTSDVKNFSYVDPQKAYIYGASDSMVLFALADGPCKKVLDSFVFMLDNNVLKIISVMEDNPVIIDINRIASYEPLFNEKIMQLNAKIISFFNHNFNINSPAQLMRALNKVGVYPVHPKDRNEDGTPVASTEEDALVPFIPQCPIIKDIIDYKVLSKQLNSYVKAFKACYKKELGGVRFHYSQVNVPTGRLSSSGDKKNSYFAKINTQAIPKPHPAYYKIAEVNSQSPDAILGVLYKQVKDKNVPFVEGADPNLSIRRCYVAPPGYYWVSLDYSAQELYLPALLSKEPVWFNTLKNGGDLHKEMAILIWGKENYDKEKRKAAKGLNFSSLYGGTKYSIANVVGCSLSDAQFMLDSWWSNLKTLKAWVKSKEQLGQTSGYIHTFFGRPRYVGKYFREKRTWGYGNRTCCNTCVQGTGSDLMKIAILRIYQNLLNVPKYADKIKLVSSIHDELNFYVTKDPAYFTEIVLMLKECMEYKPKEWEFPIPTGLEIGSSWGSLIPYKYDASTNTFYPKLDKPDWCGAKLNIDCPWLYNTNKCEMGSCLLCKDFIKIK